ncbi:MAG: hypothetical protein QG622_3670 [Actinomycetota bacterium]|nr:hypothetical protein [Actinomycetota bacterium]
MPWTYSTAEPAPPRLLLGCHVLQHLVGTYLLAGITLRDASGAVERRVQFHGRVSEVAEGVVVLRHANGELILPAEPRAYLPADPGPYRLASGEVVHDPDYLSTWSVAAEGPITASPPASAAADAHHIRSHPG